MVKQVNPDIPVDIVKTKFNPTSCNGREYECDPLRSGISIAQKDEENSLNTMGYKAVRNYIVGFVITGHSVDSIGVEVVQAHNQHNNEIGEVNDRCVSMGDCDFAFVDWDENERDIENTIFRTSSTVYEITSKTDRDSQEEGEIVWKSGVGSGLTIGDIETISTVTDRITVDAYNIDGDSGSSVFKLVNGDANLYGILTGNQNTNLYFYYSHDDVEDDIDAIASTS